MKSFNPKGNWKRRPIKVVRETVPRMVNATQIAAQNTCARALPSNVIQANKLMDHALKLRKEIERWENKNNRVSIRKRETLANTLHRFMVVYSVAYDGNPKGMDHLHKFADDCKTWSVCNGLAK